MQVDLEAKALFKSKNLAEYRSNINMATKYPKFSAAVEQFLLAFPTSHMVEASFGHVNAILTKQRNSINLQNSCDLRLKHTNCQSRINSLASAHQAHPSH